MKTIREEMGLTYSIYSSFTANMESGHFEIEVQTKNENASTVIKEIINHIEKIKKEPVSEQELEDAKSFLIGSFPRRLETTKRVTEFLSAVEFYNLGDDYMEKYPKYIQNVTLEDVLRVAKKYLNTDNFVLVVVGNKKNLRLPDL
jgi:zinc protease